MRRRRQAYRGIIVVALVCLISLTVVLGAWKNAINRKLQLEEQYAIEVMRNNQLTERLETYEESNSEKIQAEMNKKKEVEELVIAIGRFEQLSAREAWEAGLLRQYTSREIATLVRELAYSMASVSSKAERRKAIEEFENDVKALKESIKEDIDGQEIPFSEDALLYAKYLKKIF